MGAVVNEIERAITEYINSQEGPSRVKPTFRMGQLLNHSPLQESSADIRFPGLGTEDKNVERMSGFVVLI